MGDDLRQRYSQLLDGTYDCVDRIVLNAYNRFCYSAGGFREWWRRLMSGSDEQLDNAHLMRMAGRFSRRVRGSPRLTEFQLSTADAESASTTWPKTILPLTRSSVACFC